MDRNSLLERITLLRETELIKDEAFNYALSIISLLEKTEYDFNQEKLDIFITHAAIAAQRVVADDEEIRMDESVVNQLQDQESYEKAQGLLESILELPGIMLSISEKNLFLIHLCNILDESQKGV